MQPGVDDRFAIETEFELQHRRGRQCAHVREAGKNAVVLHFRPADQRDPQSELAAGMGQVLRPVVRAELEVLKVLRRQRQLVLRRRKEDPLPSDGVDRKGAVAQNPPAAQIVDHLRQRQIVKPHDLHPPGIIGVLARPVQRLQKSITVQRRRKIITHRQIRIPTETDAAVERNIRQRRQILRARFVAENHLQPTDRLFRILLIHLVKQVVAEQISGLVRNPLSGKKIAVIHPFLRRNPPYGNFAETTGTGKQQYSQQQNAAETFRMKSSLHGDP